MSSEVSQQKKKGKTWVDYTLKSLVFWVVVGIVAGVLLGQYNTALAIQMKPGIDWFIKILKWLVGPIIFLTIILGIVGLESLKKVGSIGLKAFIYFEVVSTFALAIGILAGNLLAPGTGMNIDVSTLDAASVAKYTAQGAASVQGGVGVLHEVKTILWNALPLYQLESGWYIPDPINPFLKGKTLQVLAMALTFAVLISAFASSSVRAKILKPLEKAQDVCFFVLKILMWFSPIAAFCAMAFLIGKFGIASLINMGFLLLVMLFSCCVFIFVVLGAIMSFFKINIFKFMYYIHKEVLIVFATSSSESALAPLMKRLEQAGISKGVTGLVLPTGYSFNLDCTNIYLALSIIFLAQAINVPLTLAQQISILIILMVTSKGAVGVTGSGFIVLAGTLQAVPDYGVPAVAVAILLGVDKFMSEMRAVGNLCGNAVAAVVVGAWDKQIDMPKFKYTLDHPDTVHSII